MAVSGNSSSHNFGVAFQHLTWLVLKVKLGAATPNIAAARAAITSMLAEELSDHEHAHSFPRFFVADKRVKCVLLAFDSSFRTAWAALALRHAGTVKFGFADAETPAVLPPPSLPASILARHSRAGTAGQRPQPASAPLATAPGAGFARTLPKAVESTLLHCASSLVANQLVLALAVERRVRELAAATAHAAVPPEPTAAAASSAATSAAGAAGSSESAAAGMAASASAPAPPQQRQWAVWSARDPQARIGVLMTVALVDVPEANLSARTSDATVLICHAPSAAHGHVQPAPAAAGAGAAVSGPTARGGARDAAALHGSQRPHPLADRGAAGRSVAAPRFSTAAGAAAASRRNVLVDIDMFAPSDSDDMSMTASSSACPSGAGSGSAIVGLPSAAGGRGRAGSASFSVHDNGAVGSHATPYGAVTVGHADMFVSREFSAEDSISSGEEEASTRHVAGLPGRRISPGAKRTDGHDGRDSGGQADSSLLGTAAAVACDMSRDAHAGAAANGSDACNTTTDSVGAAGTFCLHPKPEFSPSLSALPAPLSASLPDELVLNELSLPAWARVPATGGTHATPKGAAPQGPAFAAASGSASEGPTSFAARQVAAGPAASTLGEALFPAARPSMGTPTRPSGGLASTGNSGELMPVGGASSSFGGAPGGPPSLNVSSRKAPGGAAISAVLAAVHGAGGKQAAKPALGQLFGKRPSVSTTAAGSLQATSPGSGSVALPGSTPTIGAAFGGLASAGWGRGVGIRPPLTKLSSLPPPSAAQLPLSATSSLEAIVEAVGPSNVAAAYTAKPGPPDGVAAADASGRSSSMLAERLDHDDDDEDMSSLFIVDRPDGGDRRRSNPSAGSHAGACAAVEPARSTAPADPSVASDVPAAAADAPGSDSSLGGPSSQEAAVTAIASVGVISPSTGAPKDVDEVPSTVCAAAAAPPAAAPALAESSAVAISLPAGSSTVEPQPVADASAATGASSAAAQHPAHKAAAVADSPAVALMPAAETVSQLVAVSQPLPASASRSVAANPNSTTALFAQFAAHSRSIPKRKRSDDVPTSSTSVGANDLHQLDEVSDAADGAPPAKRARVGDEFVAKAPLHLSAPSTAAPSTPAASPTAHYLPPPASALCTAFISLSRARGPLVSTVAYPLRVLEVVRVSRRARAAEEPYMECDALLGPPGCFERCARPVAASREKLAAMLVRSACDLVDSCTTAAPDSRPHVMTAVVPMAVSTSLLAFGNVEPLVTSFMTAVGDGVAVPSTLHHRQLLKHVLPMAAFPSDGVWSWYCAVRLAATWLLHAASADSGRRTAVEGMKVLGARKLHRLEVEDLVPSDGGAPDALGPINRGHSHPDRPDDGVVQWVLHDSVCAKQGLSQVAAPAGVSVTCWTAAGTGTQGGRGAGMPSPGIDTRPLWQPVRDLSALLPADNLATLTGLQVVEAVLAAP